MHNLGEMMGKTKSSDLPHALIALVIAALFIGVMCLGGWLMSAIKAAHWRDIYLLASPGGSAIFLFLIPTGAVNNAPGVPNRLGLACCMFVAGLVAIMFGASYLAALMPRIDAFDGFAEACGGYALASLFIDGVPVQVTRNLFAKKLDYPNRLFPFVAIAMSLAILCFWSWQLYRRWIVQDHTVVIDLACFGLGLLCALVAGQRQASAVPLAADVSPSN